MHKWWQLIFMCILTHFAENKRWSALMTMKTTIHSKTTSKRRRNAIWQRCVFFPLNGLVLTFTRKLNIPTAMDTLKCTLIVPQNLLLSSLIFNFQEMLCEAGIYIHKFIITAPHRATSYLSLQSHFFQFHLDAFFVLMHAHSHRRIFQHILLLNG